MLTRDRGPAEVREHKNTNLSLPQTPRNCSENISSVFKDRITESFVVQRAQQKGSIRKSPHSGDFPLQFSCKGQGEFILIWKSPAYTLLFQSSLYSSLTETGSTRQTRSTYTRCVPYLVIAASRIKLLACSCYKD